MELEYVLLIVLYFACTAVSSLDYGKRSDDVDRLDALETLVQTQASTIQSLQARLNSLDNTNQQLQGTLHLQDVTIQQQGATLQQQGATIQSLQSRLDTEDRTNQDLRDTIRSLQSLQGVQNQTNTDLQTSIQHQEQTLQQQGNTIQQQGSTIQQQGSTIQQHGQTLTQQSTSLLHAESDIRSLQNSVQSVSTKQGLVAGFYADFGTPLSHYVNLTSGRPVIFNRVLTNVGNAYDQSTGVFTSPTAGLYTFHLHFMGGNHSATTELGIFKGNDWLALSFSEGSQRDSNDQGSCTAVTHLNKGDRVSVQFNYGVSVQGVWGYTFTSFSGMLVHAD